MITHITNSYILCPSSYGRVISHSAVWEDYLLVWSPLEIINKIVKDKNILP